MQRRQFNALATGALASVMLNPWQQVLAQGATFKAGTDYMVLPKPLPTDVAKGKLEVLEFFWYNCPHCNAFEPALSAWSKKLPKDVELKRVPVRFREDFEAQQRAYYVLEALGKVEELQSKMFASIHVEKQNLAKLENLVVWAEKNGIPSVKFTELFKDISGVKFSSGNVALSSSELARMPNVLFTFEGTDGKPFTILMPWTNYVDSVGGGKYAFRIYLTEGSGIVLGANFMTGMDVVFDQVRALVYGPLPAPPLLCMLRRGR